MMNEELPVGAGRLPPRFFILHSYFFICPRKSTHANPAGDGGGSGVKIVVCQNSKLLVSIRLRQICHFSGRNYCNSFQKHDHSFQNRDSSFLLTEDSFPPHCLSFQNRDDSFLLGDYSIRRLMIPSGRVAIPTGSEAIPAGKGTVPNRVFRFRPLLMS